MNYKEKLKMIGFLEAERETPPQGRRRAGDTISGGVNGYYFSSDENGSQINVDPGSVGVSPAKGWYSRNYLPHCDVPGLIQAITFRLADALPREVLERFDREEIKDDTRRRKIEGYLDSGHGQCWLRQKPIARIIEQALLHFDGRRYRILAWCIMPNHVHTLVEMPERSSLAKLVHSWKSYSAKEINKVLRRKGTVWQREYHDRYIRDNNHFVAAITYIHENPVKAGLVEKSWQWPFGSARLLSTESRRDAGAPKI